MRQALDEMWLEGTVGESAVRAYVGPAGWPKEDGLWGLYYHTKYWSPLPLEGTWAEPGQLLLTEGTTTPLDVGPKPRFDLAISKSRVFEGSWTSADGKQTLPVRLKRVPKPPSYELAMRRPRRFANPRWAIALSYPAAWRLDVTDTQLRLRSPDPLDMLFEAQLTCERGTGLPRPPGIGSPPVDFGWPLFRDPSGWLVADMLDTHCTEGACERLAPRRVKVGAFMTGWVGYRKYGPWGYEGIAESAVYLAMFEEEWVRCIDRKVLDSDTRIEVVEVRTPKR